MTVETVKYFVKKPIKGGTPPSENKEAAKAYANIGFCLCKSAKSMSLG